MRKPVRVLALAAAAVSATADAAQPQWEGVWQGTIGTLPVRVCLVQHDADWSHGSYYYLSKLIPIALQKAASNTEWTEHEGGGVEVGGLWTLANAGAARLTGQWRSNGARNNAGRRLPIALTRVPAGASEEGPCGSQGYMAPRIKPVTVKTKPASKNGVSYTEVTYEVGPAFPDVSITSFALREEQPGDRAINTALRLDPAKKDGPADYRSCAAGQLSMHGTDGSFFVEYSPELVTAEFVSVAISEGGDCGGAHPFSSQSHLTFDRRTGAKIDLASWFATRAVPPRGPGETGSIVKIGNELRGAVTRHARIAEAECREVVAGADYWDLGLARRGIVFTPSLPHVAAACEEATIVPFAALSAMLSPAGKAGAARVGSGR